MLVTVFPLAVYVFTLCIALLAPMLPSIPRFGIAASSLSILLGDTGGPSGDTSPELADVVDKYHGRPKDVLTVLASDFMSTPQLSSTRTSAEDSAYLPPAFYDTSELPDGFMSPFVDTSTNKSSRVYGSDVLGVYDWGGRATGVGALALLTVIVVAGFAYYLHTVSLHSSF